MRRTMIIGIILLVLGILGFVFQRVTFLQTKNVVDLGPVQVQTQERKSLPIPDIAAGVAVAAGLILIVAGGRSGGGRS